MDETEKRVEQVANELQNKILFANLFRGATFDLEDKEVPVKYLGKPIGKVVRVERVDDDLTVTVKIFAKE
jgi:hypothetical protein